MLCMAVTTQLFAQDEVWYFGGYWTNPSTSAGIQFNGGSLTSRNNEAAYYFYESSSVVSDGAGNVLFYTDGLKVWDKNHAVMTNGSGLIGSNEPGNSSGSGVQGVLSINDPGNPQRYYIFTGPSVEQTSNNVGLHYNVVDLSVGAAGSVITKNQTLLNGNTTKVAEAMAAISKSCDTTWLVVHGVNNSFYAFEITAAGVNTTPVTSSVGPTLLGTQFAQGSMDFSPQGDRLAYSSGYGLYLFDFDIKTGKISNSLPVASTTSYWGTEFSPDGSKLYYSQYTLGELRQYDVCTGTITLLDASVSTLGELTTGKDGKIYGVYNGNNVFSGNTLLCINNPNNAGAACNVNLNAYNTGMGLGPGLPQMYFSPQFLNGGPVQVNITRTLPDTVCDSFIPTCAGLSVAPAVSGVWRSVPSGYVNAHGVFDPSINTNDTTVVKIFFGMEPCVLEDSTTIVVINCCKKINTNAPAGAICPGDSLDLNALVTDGIGNWSIFQKPVGSKPATVAAPWFKSKLKTDPGTYQITFKLTTPEPGCKDSTIEKIVIKTPPPAPASLTANFCVGDSVSISAGDLSYNYLWNPGGSSANTLKVKSTGNYIVTKTSPLTSCIAIDTIAVSSLPLPNGSIADTSVCVGGTININAGNWTNYLWDDNISSTQTHSISSTGKHWVIVGNSSCKDTLFFNVNAGDSLKVALNNPGKICSGASVTLNAALSGVFANPLTYSWDGIAGTSSKVFNSGISHNVLVSDGRNCKGTKSVSLIFAATPFVSLGIDTSRCFKEHEKYTAAITDTFASITWMDDSTEPTLTISSAKIVSVKVTNSDGCSDTDSILVNNSCKPAEPCFTNVVTPNSDSYNDNFTTCDSVSIEKFEEISIIIYDRWGIKMFESSGVMPKWDCKFNGNTVAPGVYYWISRWKNTAEIDGEKTGWMQVMY